MGGGAQGGGPAGSGGQGGASCKLGTVDDCGTCGTRCKGLDADWACVGGMCVVTGCKNDRADCNKLASDGCETRLSTDNDNCGLCGVQCGLLGLTTCKNSLCVLGL